MAKSENLKEEEDRIPADRPPSFSPKEYAEKIDVFKDLYHPIGAIVMAFSRLESSLTMTIDALCGLTHAEGIAYEALMINFSVRIRLFSTLAMLHTKPKSLRDDIKVLVSRLNHSNTKRNDFVHGPWSGVSGDGKTFFKAKYRAETELKQIERLHKVTVNDIWEAHKYIVATTILVQKWRNKFSAAHYPPGVYRTVRFPFPDK